MTTSETKSKSKKESKKKDRKDKDKDKDKESSRKDPDALRAKLVKLQKKLYEVEHEGTQQMKSIDHRLMNAYKMQKKYSEANAKLKKNSTNKIVATVEDNKLTISQLKRETKDEEKYLEKLNKELDKLCKKNDKLLETQNSATSNFGDTHTDSMDIMGTHEELEYEQEELLEEKDELKATIKELRKDGMQKASERMEMEKALNTMVELVTEHCKVKKVKKEILALVDKAEADAQEIIDSVNKKYGKGGSKK